jgi:DHA1 family multidrug resistance protein-like MFS transporter
MIKLFKENSWQRTLYIMLFAQFVSTMGFSMIFPFFPLYVQHLGTNTGLSLEFWAGMVFAVQGATMMIAAPIWGSVADRYGRKVMVERAMFGGAILILWMGFVNSAEELALVRAIQGFVTGVIPAASALVAAAAPRERSGYAMGLLQLGQWSGIAVGPLMGGFMADTWGFRSAFISTAVSLLFGGILVRLSIKEVFISKPGKVHPFAFLGQWRQIIFAPGVGPVYLARMLSWLGRTMLAPILPLFVVTLMPESNQISTFTGLVVGVAAAASTASAVYLGRLGDRVGHRWILMASAAGAAIFYTLQIFTTQAWQLLLFQALAGAATGGVMPSISALLSQYTQPGQEGAVYGIDSSVAAAARAVAPMVGAGLAVWVGMQGTFVATGLCFVCAAIMAIRWLPDYKKAAQPQAV